MTWLSQISFFKEAREMFERQKSILKRNSSNLRSDGEPEKSEMDSPERMRSSSYARAPTTGAKQTKGDTCQDGDGDGDVVDVQVKRKKTAFFGSDFELREGVKSSEFQPVRMESKPATLNDFDGAGQAQRYEDVGTRADLDRIRGGKPAEEVQMKMVEAEQRQRSVDVAFSGVNLVSEEDIEHIFEHEKVNKSSERSKNGKDGK
jgi:hypothetical protein